jgi:hypothetical protein
MAFHCDYFYLARIEDFVRRFMTNLLPINILLVLY